MQNERLAIPQSGLNIPHWNWPHVGRVDNAFGDRNPGLPRHCATTPGLLLRGDTELFLTATH
ncbi:MAG: hypothetical protein KBH45_20010 [Verrucomicrobia bacterium]|nr:hypothetical protein [Verrucomicrobiota bacterium]